MRTHAHTYTLISISPNSHTGPVMICQALHALNLLTVHSSSNSQRSADTRVCSREGCFEWPGRYHASHPIKQIYFAGCDTPVLKSPPCTDERTRVKINKFSAALATAEPQTYPFLISRSLKAGLRVSMKTQDVLTSGPMITIYKSYLNSTPHLTARVRRRHVLDEAVWRNKMQGLGFRF